MGPPNTRNLIFGELKSNGKFHNPRTTLFWEKSKHGGGEKREAKQIIVNIGHFVMPQTTEGSTHTLL
jgi:hypothetical protein